MAFRKGQSGNPGGRPKADAQVKELARAHTTAAVGALVKALKAKSERTRVAAAEALLDRGWGKPAQEIQHSGEIGRSRALCDLTDDELAVIAASGAANPKKSPPIH
jgi:uncharacterized protein DUF5681